ncbi:MAG: GNAT family N-acetyltransferase [Planctomycetota bacterium]
MLIRKIRHEDNEAVAGVIRAVMTEFEACGPGYSIEDAEVDRMFESYQDSKSVFYVLDDDGVVGCGGLGPLAGGEASYCELKKMYFMPVARGLGYGRILGEMLIVDATRIGYEWAYIETLERMLAARGLYETLGFQRLNEPMGSTGHHACDACYRLKLEPSHHFPELFE